MNQKNTLLKKTLFTNFNVFINKKNLNKKTNPKVSFLTNNYFIFNLIRQY